MTPDEPRIDTSVRIVTPENIAFEHRVAGPFRRLPAYLIDLVIRMIIVATLAFGAMMLFGTIGLTGFGLGAIFVGWFLLDWFYGGVFEALWNGQTPGKRATSLRVVSVEGTPISGWQAVLRNFLRFADAMPVMTLAPTYVAGFLATTMNDRYQRLGDLAAGTMVVVEQRERQVGVVPMDEPPALKLAAALPAEVRVSRGLARALSAYVQRRRVFSAARRAEMAGHVARPLAVRYGLPSNTNPDTLLCALYYRAFIADRPFEADRAARRTTRTAETAQA